MESRIPQDHWLRNVKIAHRGLHDDESPENSLSAYQKAADKKLAIEIDVHLTTDDRIVVFHDDTLKRMTGVDKKITDCSLPELKSLKLGKSEETIPTLEEVLVVCEGKSPLLIEIKGQSTKVGRLEKIMYDLLKEYKGDFAIQSFNPFSVLWYTKNAPQFIRGQLSSDFKRDTLKWYKKILLKNLFFNNKTKPDFVSYDEACLPNRVCVKARKQGKLIIAWTIRDNEREMLLRPYYDNIIFEFYTPKNLHIEK